MKVKSKYSLQRTMMVYFLLIGFAALFVGVEFIAETHCDGIREAFIERIADHGIPMAQDDIMQPLNHLRNKAILVIAIIMVVILIVMTMFMKHITEPLQHMIAAARRISGGDLSPTIRIDEHNELAELGGVINEMSSNLQEIIAIAGNACNSGESILATIDSALEHTGLTAAERTHMERESARFRSELTMLRSMLDCFRCYANPEANS